MEGEQGERSIEIRAWKMQRNRFHFCRALKDAVSLLVEIVFCEVLFKRKKKEKRHSQLKHLFRGHTGCLYPPLGIVLLIGIFVNVGPQMHQ